MRELLICIALNSMLEMFVLQGNTSGQKPSSFSEMTLIRANYTRTAARKDAAQRKCIKAKLHCAYENAVTQIDMPYHMGRPLGSLAGIMLMPVHREECVV